LEREAVLALLAACVVVLSVLALGFFAVLKMKPVAFRLRTTLLRVFTFSMEIESSSTAAKPAAGPGQDQAGASGAAAQELAQPQVRSKG
jgi:hypothetical protein